MTMLTSWQYDRLVEQIVALQQPTRDDVLVVERRVVWEGSANETCITHDDVVDEASAAKQENATIAADNSVVGMINHDRCFYLP